MKSRRIWNLLDFLVHAADADIASMAAIPTDLLRYTLLGLPGIGPETADAILLYALDRPTFPVDAYLRLVLQRHMAVSERSSYESLRLAVIAALGHDGPRLHHYHASIVELGKRHCGKSGECDECPLDRDRIASQPRFGGQIRGI